MNSTSSRPAEMQINGALKQRVTDPNQSRPRLGDLGAHSHLGGFPPDLGIDGHFALLEAATMLYNAL